MPQNVVYIGSENYPLPYIDKNGKIKLLSNDSTYISLPVLYEGAPESVQTKAIGTLWRHLPPRGRLNSFLSDLRRRSSNIDSDQNTSIAFKQRRRAKLTFGMPGSGKTYKSQSLGKLVSPNGAIYVNCKDMDLKSLIVQTVLDTSNIDVEKNAIDARIKMYNKGDKTALSAEGIALLRQMFEDAFTTDNNGIISLDWTAAKNNTSYTSSNRDREFISLLQQFCKREHIEYTQNLNNIGFVEKDGKLIEAIESGRPIILDEINRGKNQDFLLPYLDFLNGGYESMDIEAANGRMIHLRKEDLPDTFMLEAIGNPETLEMGIKEKMSEPLKDRFDIEYIEDYTPQDFTDMFCSYATGVPISIVKDAFKVKNDEELSKICKSIRVFGLTEEEKRAIPEDQKIYLENSAQFLAAAEIVGKSLYDLYEYKKQCSNSSVCEDSKLRQHIKETPFSFRLIEDIFNRVKTYIPQNEDTLKKNPFLQYAYAAPSGQNTLKMRMERQGEALEFALKEVVKEIFSSQDANPKMAEPVLGYANSILSQNGVGEEELFEARNIGQNRLKNLFTFTAKRRVSEEALQIQEIICKMIKQAHPEKESLSNDELINPIYIDTFMADIRETPVNKHPIIGKVSSINTNTGSSHKKPFIETSVIETFGLVDSIKPEDLVEAKAFLTTLAFETLSENNIKTIWPKMFATNQTQMDNTSPEVLNVLSGKSSDILYNSFVLKDKENKKIVLDIIHTPNAQSQPSTLIIGENIDQLTQARLKKKGILYVDRNNPTANEEIKVWTKEHSEHAEILYAAIRLKHELLSDNKDNVIKELLKSYEDRNNKDNMAQITTYLPSELSSKQYIDNQEKNATMDDVFTIISQLEKNRGK